MHPAQQLRRLQDTDMSLAKVERLLAQIASSLGETEALQEIRLAVQSTEVELQRWQTALRDRELEVSSVSGKIRASEDRVYGGRVRNPKELKNLQEELLSLRRRRSNREDAVLEAMLEVEQLGETLGEQRETLARAQSEWQAEQKALLAAQAKLEAQQSGLLVQREEQASVVGPDLQLYEGLRRRKAGQPVALLKDGVCQACGMALPTGEVQRVKYSGELCCCSSCGRILWAG
jgi:predicted  nucleic acid-binding Zn-ribbon protein